LAPLAYSSTAPLDRMTLRLRQIALAARDLERAADDIAAVFGAPAPFHDPGVGMFGLHNAVFALGDTFLEIVSPLRDDASAARFLARKGGDAGYMVILQTDDLDRERRRLIDLGVRVVFETQLEEIATIHLHPRDVGGAIVSLDEARPAASWRWAGEGWERKTPSKTAGVLRAAEIASRDPTATAMRWAVVLGTAPPQRSGAVLDIPLSGSRLRFVACDDDAAEGLVAVEIDALNRAAVFGSARSRGLLAGEDEILLCGTRFRLVGRV
jgi:hypothetical protein